MLKVCANENALTANEIYERVKQYTRHSVTETRRQQCICRDLDRYAVDNESGASPGEILDMLLASCMEVYDQEVFKASLITVVLRVVKHFGCEQSDARERDGDLKISLYRLFSNNPIRKEYDKPSICKRAKELVLAQCVSGQKMGMK